MIVFDYNILREIKTDKNLRKATVLEALYFGQCNLVSIINHLLFCNRCSALY